MTDADRAKERAKRAAYLQRFKASRPPPFVPTNCSACWRLTQCIGTDCPIGRGA